jgi:uncharacterized BrkB/YihY/UPF0761 family membrane protein
VAEFRHSARGEHRIATEPKCSPNKLPEESERLHNLEHKSARKFFRVRLQLSMGTAAVVLVAIGSLVLGGLVPIFYDGIIRFAQRKFAASRKTPWPTAFLAFLVSFGATSAGLVYLSTTSGGQPRVIVIAFIIGVGLVRWFRGDYRYK